MALVIGRMKDADWPAVRSIYEEGIATGNASIETELPGWKEWHEGHLRCCRLVARLEGRVVGWAALSPVLSRSAYAGVAGVSIYVSAFVRGRGIGKALLRALVEQSEGAGIWTLQARIFPENTTSVRLHRSCEFRIVGTRERLGRLNGAWRDVVLMERRSKVVGV